MGVILTKTLKKEKGLMRKLTNPLIVLARPERFERPTPWFVAKYSIQLSYGRLKQGAHYSRIRNCRKEPRTETFTGFFTPHPNKKL